MKKYTSPLILLTIALLLACHTNKTIADAPHPVDSLPSKRLLFIGQDLNSINGYLQQCGDCPQPDGYIAYISMGYLTQKDFYGGLGYCKNGKHHTANVDWGAGPLNAYSLLAEHPGSHLQIGLYMVKQARKLAEGELDKDIKHLSKFFREFPSSTFYLRIGYEFDGEWNDYYPGEFVKAYRYLVDGLRKRKVTNVKYVWHACASPIDDIIEGYKEDLMPYYPGDEYVDWLAISWFLPPQVGPVGSSQKELSDELVAIARLKNKPLMIAESANQGYSNSDLTKRNITEILDGKAGRDRLSKSADQIWAEWYAPLFAWMEENGDVVKAFSYINANWDSQQMWGPPYKQGYWGDSRIEANEELKKRWKEEFSKPFWKEGR